MEVKINREIREYTESMFFGLSIRQFFFSMLGIIMALVLYFLFREKLSTETISWVCVLGAVPFAVLGFITYHGMNAEQFIFTWLKSEILCPKKLLFIPENIYYIILTDKRKGGIKHDKNLKNNVQSR